MVWIKATYQFASLFSYRIPDFSPQYALSSILPGPSTIKLAIVSEAIISKDIKYGEEIFGIVKNAQIKLEVPKKVVVSNVLIRRLTQKKEKKETNGKTFGIRGYVHILEPLNIYIEVEDKKSDIKNLMGRIRYLGTSDSLVYCCETPREENPPEKAIGPVEFLEKKDESNILVVPIKDINSSATFEDVNIFLKPEKRKLNDILLRKVYLIPMLHQQQGKNWIIYEFA